jgi:hypothetical protein
MSPAQEAADILVNIVAGARFQALLRSDFEGLDPKHHPQTGCADRIDKFTTHLPPVCFHQLGNHDASSGQTQTDERTALKGCMGVSDKAVRRQLSEQNIGSVIVRPDHIGSGLGLTRLHRLRPVMRHACGNCHICDPFVDISRCVADTGSVTYPSNTAWILRPSQRIAVIKLSPRR